MRVRRRVPLRIRARELVLRPPNHCTQGSKQPSAASAFGSVLGPNGEGHHSPSHGSEPRNPGQLQFASARGTSQGPGQSMIGCLAVGDVRVLGSHQHQTLLCLLQGGTTGPRGGGLPRGAGERPLLANGGAAFQGHCAQLCGEGYGKEPQCRGSCLTRTLPPDAALSGRFLCGTVNNFVAEVGKAYERAIENKQEADTMARKVSSGGALPGGDARWDTSAPLWQTVRIAGSCSLGNRWI